eukprot:CAMPEP_0197049642 /NCGR_PEP_ID=MMETSP1384-20130603/24743_1 /TAXON_ID=29189 /ORGANISM="Ammonia sp." /LENGTH=476 /DNA_ID=CAMNT_0042481949 /DNA_START=83 /DNA_END=1513 /DNA_ORIENTATION=-
MASKKYIQRHWPPGSDGCVRDVQFDASGKASVKRTNGQFAAMDSVIQDAIAAARQKGEKHAVYEFRGSKYYIDLSGEPDADPDGDDSKSDKEDEDFFGADDLNTGPPAFSFVGDGASYKIDDIQFNSNQSVAALKADFADKMSCDPDEIGMLAYQNGKFVEVKVSTLAANKVTDIKDLVVFKKEDQKEAVKKLIRAKKWDDKPFRKQAKQWLADTGNAGKAGINNLVTKNDLAPAWNDLLSKLKYRDVLQIIKNEHFAMNVDKLRTDANERKKWGISDDEVKFIDFTEYTKIVKKTEALRDTFYDEMSKMALKGTKMQIDTDSLNIMKQFPPDSTQNKFFGIISLIDGSELKAMGILCKGLAEIVKGKIYMYPGFDHNKKLQWKGGQGKANVGTSSGGHWTLCEYVGIPPEFVCGFAIETPTLKFRSGTNTNKPAKVKGFSNGRAVNDVIQACIKNTFQGTIAEKFYSKIDPRPYS